MAEMSKAYTPEFMGDPNPREKILKLARKITDCVDHKILGVTVKRSRILGTCLRGYRRNGGRRAENESASSLHV